MGGESWFQFTFVSGVPCTVEGGVDPLAIVFQFTFVSGVPCTGYLFNKAGDPTFQFTFVSGVPCTSMQCADCSPSVPRFNSPS